MQVLSKSGNFDSQGGEIDFPQYIKAVERTQLVTFLQSAHGKALANKAGSAEKLVGAGLYADSMSVTTSIQ